MTPLKLPPTSLVYPLVLERRADELAALLNKQGDRLKVTVGAGAVTWNTQPSGNNFAIVSSADGVRLSANADEVVPSDVGVSSAEHDEKHLWSFVTETQ